MKNEETSRRKVVTLEKHIYEASVMYKSRVECRMSFATDYDDLHDERWVAEVLLNELAEFVNDISEDTLLLDVATFDHRSANEEGQEKGNEDARES